VSYLVVGDVHGCLEELRTLVDEYTRDGRQPVHVGDLVAKGPDSRGVVAFAAERGMLGVRGNHDERVLMWQDAIDRGRTPSPVKPEHMHVCQELGEAEWKYLRALPYFLRLPDVGALVVHGGMLPGIAVEKQQPEHLVAMRTIRPDGRPSDRLTEGVLWGSKWLGPEEVVFGHDAVTGLQQHPFATGIDTACVYGGKLTGYLLPERRLVHVEARRNWSGKPPLARRVLAGVASAITRGAPATVTLSPSPRGIPRRAIVVRGTDGALRAYVDLCKHLPIPLVASGKSALDETGEHLVCRTHGATYRVDDGHCIEGPCAGDALDPLEIVERDGEVWVVDRQ
jgi:nitrite reductase/ring-hydroxylating ferredoxin subunit